MQLGHDCNALQCIGCFWIDLFANGIVGPSENAAKSFSVVRVKRSGKLARNSVAGKTKKGKKPEHFLSLSLVSSCPYLPVTGGNTSAQPVALRSKEPSLGGGETVRKEGNRRFFR